MSLPSGKHSPSRSREQWRTFLHENVLLYRLLTPQEQDRLLDITRAVLGRTFWEGCGGLEMTDEIKVTIAAQASLMLLGFEEYLFDKLRSVLVYPGGFLGTHEDALGGEDEVG